MDSTLACLAAWMPRQRWYAAKGRSPSLRLVSWWDLDPVDPSDAGARIRTYLVADEGVLPAVLYQIPVVARETADVTADPDHIIGSPEPGTTFIDAPHDPAYAHALLRMMQAGALGAGPYTSARGAAVEPVSDTIGAARVMTGEQSNTSIIFETDPVPVICKIYRQLQEGENPDVELPTALAAAGSPHVPRAFGRVSGTWPDPAVARRTASGVFASAQEYFADVEDAWRVALSAAARADDFREPAAELGEATASVHRSLAQLFPTAPVGPGGRAAVRASWERRLRIAIAEVPEIETLHDGILSVYEMAERHRWPTLQRIHGDVHLGQAIHVPSRGWVLLDFEGEPLRPMSERRAPDLALRDVAGMLRSFDYVAGSTRLTGDERSEASVREWARDARRGFLEGYAQNSGVALSGVQALIAALELDKAVYEATYEARNRPTWTSIPLSAISRLVGHSPAPATRV